MIVLQLGNAHTHISEPVLDDAGIETGEYHRDYAKADDVVTTVELDRLDMGLLEAVSDVAAVWAVHGIEAPLWVSCPEWPALAEVVAEQLGAVGGVR